MQYINIIMRFLKKIFGVPHYPKRFKGRIIDYNYIENCRLCSNIAYTTFNKSEFKKELSPILFYCPHCQELFGIPKTVYSVIVL